jgi:hypothetical protein
MAKRKQTTPRPASGSGRHTPPGGARRHSEFAGRQLAIAVLDQECCGEASDLFPTSFDWRDPDEYLAQQEAFAREITESGGEAFYAFIEPADYVEWCREQGRDVDSQASRAAFAGVILGEGDAIPYSPDQPLWPIGVTSMVLRSELGAELDEPGDHVEAFLERFADLVLSQEGRYRSVVTASRYRVHDEAELWQHFAAAITSQTTLTFCDEYLSLTDRIEHRGDTVHSTDHGDHNPFEAVLSLAAVGHGVVGLEHRNGEEFSFRAFEVTHSGAVPVPADVLGRRLGTPDAPSLRSGWDEVGQH